jgi:hypothetical protein
LLDFARRIRLWWWGAWVAADEIQQPCETPAGPRGSRGGDEI